MYYYGDIHVFGEYPDYIKAFQKNHGMHLDITTDDLQCLREGCVDYIGISYYMSETVSAKPGDTVRKFSDTCYMTANRMSRPVNGVGRLTRRGCATRA